MKRIFLLIVVPALLAAIGFAQTPAASGSSDQINVKGCLGGSEGNYTVAEDNTGTIFKITTSSSDLKAYVGQDVNLTGHKAGTAAENSLAVTEMNMISEHCTGAAAAPAVAPAAAVSTPSDTLGTPPPAAAAAAPEATVSAPADTKSIAVAAAPSATVSSPVEPASAPAAPVPVHRAHPAARPQKPAAPAAAAAAPPEPASKPVPVADAPAAQVDSPREAADAPPPAAPVVAPRPASTRSTLMLGSIVVVVLLLVGGGVPLYNRWRKRNLQEQTRGQNLSFTHSAKSDPGTIGTTGGRKAA